MTSPANLTEDVETYPYTVTQLIEKSGASRAFLTKALRDGRIKGIRFGTKYRISEKEFKRVLKEGVAPRPKK